MSNIKSVVTCIFVAITLSGCETYNASLYSISADTNLAIKSLKINESVSVGIFTSNGPIDMQCRAAGPIQLPRGTQSITAYVQKAFEDELKIAGAYSSQSPKAILTGNLTKVSFSSSKNLNSGFWNFDLTVTSNNGKSITVTEYYEFESGFNATTACNNTANAIMPAVQNLVGKAIRSPQFAGLLSQ